MRAKHACNSYKCITRLIVTGTRHYYAGWAWSYTNVVHSARTACKTPPKATHAPSPTLKALTLRPTWPTRRPGSHLNSERPMNQPLEPVCHYDRTTSHVHLYYCDARSQLLCLPPYCNFPPYLLHQKLELPGLMAFPSCVSPQRANTAQHQEHSTEVLRICTSFGLLVT